MPLKSETQGFDTGIRFVHPFDDHNFVAGNATIGLEILEDLPTKKHLFSELDRIVKEAEDVVVQHRWLYDSQLRIAAEVERREVHGERPRPPAGVRQRDQWEADLGVDPGVTGCQSFEATDFLLRRRQVDPSAVLVLWQVSVLGIRHYEPEPTPQNLDVLLGYLLQWYAPTHRVTLYEASPYPLVEASIRELELAELPDSRPSPLATLYVPPSETRGNPRASATAV